MDLMIATFALQRFLDIRNAPSPGFRTQTALLHYVLSLRKEIELRLTEKLTA